MEIINWISAKIGGPNPGYISCMMHSPVVQNTQAISNPSPVVPPKPVSSVTLEEPRIDNELNQLCAQLSLEELRELVSNKKALAEKYFDLEAVQDSKTKLHEYIKYVQKRATEVIQLKETLKVDAGKYDNTLSEYKSIENSIAEIKSKVDKSGGSGGVNAILNKRKNKLDAEIQKMSKEFREAGTRTEEEVSEFISKYYNSMKDYNRCSMLLGSLPEH